jgi:hypothetical protein
MKLSIEQQINRFKLLHGDGETTIGADGRLNAPKWLVEMVYHLSGIRSKRSRIKKKTVTRRINELLERAINDSR